MIRWEVVSKCKESKKLKNIFIDSRTFKTKNGAQTIMRAYQWSIDSELSVREVEVITAQERLDFLIRKEYAVLSYQNMFYLIETKGQTKVGAYCNSAQDAIDFGIKDEKNGKL